MYLKHIEEILFLGIDVRITGVELAEKYVNWVYAKKIQNGYYIKSDSIERIEVRYGYKEPFFYNVAVLAFGFEVPITLNYSLKFTIKYAIIIKWNINYTG